MPTDPPPEAAPDSRDGIGSRQTRRAVVPAAATPARLVAGADSEGKTLTIPRSITFNGRIGPCERLMVEGAVETELDSCRVLAIAASGVFRGSADVERADISGTVEGSLIVREILTLRASGRILGGAISYGEIEIERGGTVIGTVRPRLEDVREAAPADKGGIGAS